MERWKWWQPVLFGLLFLALGAYLYWDLSAMERQGGERHYHSLIVSLYQIGGKWLASGFFFAVGVGAVVLGVKQRMTSGHPSSNSDTDS